MYHPLSLAKERRGTQGTCLRWVGMEVEVAEAAMVAEVAMVEVVEVVMVAIIMPIKIM